MDILCTTFLWTVIQDSSSYVWITFHDLLYAQYRYTERLVMNESLLHNGLLLFEVASNMRCLHG